MNSEKYELGMKTRRDLLGDTYVDGAMGGPEDFSRPFQDLAVEYCFGSIWARQGLPVKTRSLVNLGILIALNRAHEFEVHLRLAIRNGCTKKEIQEVLLQATVYCGMPAGGESFRIARKVFDEESLLD